MSPIGYFKNVAQFLKYTIGQWALFNPMLSLSLCTPMYVNTHYFQAMEHLAISMIPM